MKVPEDNYAEDFGPFSAVWLNASHQGALPKVAVSALEEAIEWKRSPQHLATSDLFSRVPEQLRQALGKLINAPPEDVILGNSASYGLHLLANGIPWRAGDEVLVVKGDFPCNILPWLALEKRGVAVRVIRPEGEVLRPEDLSKNITPSTRLVCTSWVFSFTGHMIDLAAMSGICRAKGVKLVLNCSQAIGTQPFDVANRYADAVTCVGFKWLCGPYGTGYCWIDPELREALEYNQAYWLAMQTAEDLKSALDIPRIKENLGARKYDVFGTANFFNFVPWTASINYLLEQGIDRIKLHNDALVRRLIDGVDPGRYHICLPARDDRRSTVVFISHEDAGRNPEIHEELKRNGIHVSLRAGLLRFAPHLYNTADEIDEALSILNAS